MEQPNHPTAFEGGKPQQGPGERIIRVLAYAGLAGAILYKFTMIYGGLIGTSLLPANPLVPDQVAAFGVSALIAAAILVLYLTFSYFVFRIRWVLIVVLGLSLVMTEVFFSFFSLTFKAHGDDAVQGVQERTRSVQRQLVGVDEGITRIFMGQIEALDQSRIDACNGRDETGIATCGSISNGFLQRATNLRNSYAALLSAPTIAPDPRLSSLAGGIDRIDEDIQRMRPKVAAFARFARDAGINTSDIDASFEKIANDADQLRDDLPNSSPNAGDIVVQRTFGDLSAIGNGTAGPEVYLRVVIAGFPALLSLFFSLVLSATGEAMSSVHLERQIRATKAKAYLVRKLADAQQGLGRAFTKLMGARILADVADSVAMRPRSRAAQAAETPNHGE